MLTRKTTLIFLSIFFLSGCTMIPDYHRPVSPVARKWRDTPARTEHTDAGVMNEWQAFYRDPLIQTLIKRALDNNRDLHIAQQQVEAASAQFDIENAALLPQLDGMAGANVQKMNSRIWSLSQGDGPFFMRQYGVGFGVSAYEVDLWGRVRSASRAAFDRYIAEALSRESMRLSVTASITVAVLHWEANNQNLQITKNLIENRRENYALLSKSATTGTISALSLAEAEALLRDAEKGEQIFYRQRELAFNQIELLAGSPLDKEIKTALESKGNLDNIVPFPEVPPGLPSEMMLRRPDIRAAEQSLRAANDDIGSARAEFFPKIQITASNGTASNNITRLFEGGMGAWNVAPQITLPLFDAGRLGAQLRQAKSLKSKQVAVYEKAVQVAFREAADSIISHDTFRRQSIKQQELVDANQRAYSLTSSRFNAGYDPFLNTLVAQVSLYSAQIEAVNTQLQTMTSLITLYKALGGGWSQNLKPKSRPMENKIL